MRYSFLLFLYLSIFIVNDLFCQQDYKDVDFRSPLGIPLILSGNFAELRSNHFHTGLDVKTNGSENYRIYAIDSGYVSRINIAHWGYGKAIYVDHPNGFTSVYAHLSRFPDKIETYLRMKQFDQELETVTLYPNVSDLKVNKGEVIAYSGNTGSSSGPHLHFEIRETESEKPVNPLLFNFDVADNIPPSIYHVKIYPFKNGFINGSSDDKLIKVIGDNKNYRLEHSVKASGLIGFGIHTIDKLNGASNKCGIYKVTLFLDQEIIYQLIMEKLDFNTNRYINAHKDYNEYKHKRRSIHKSFISDNNELDVYENVVNNGLVLINENRNYHFKYIVEDANGNVSELSFDIQGEEEKSIAVQNSKQQLNAVLKKDSIVNEEFEAIFPKKSMYEPTNLLYDNKDYSDGLTDLHMLGQMKVPMHKYFVLKLKMGAVADEYIDKALIVELSNDLKKLSSLGGQHENGWIQTETRSLGNYTVKLDTMPPVIKPINIYEGKNMEGVSKIEFKISDNLSGIQDYDVWIDDSWVLSNYIPKRARLMIVFNKYNKVEKGKHQIKVKITDERGNVSIKDYGFTY